MQQTIAETERNHSERIRARATHWIHAFRKIVPDEKTIFDFCYRHIERYSRQQLNFYRWYSSSTTVFVFGVCANRARQLQRAVFSSTYIGSDNEIIFHLYERSWTIEWSTIWLDIYCALLSCSLSARAFIWLKHRMNADSSNVRPTYEYIRLENYV